jgi:hypothetical protein
MTTPMLRCKSVLDEDFEAFAAVKIHVKVFWIVKPCRVVVRYQRFRGPHPEDEGSADLRNVGIPP